ncbi:MAG: PAS domain-containing protein, partial [Candidatus Atribacteria bacterium]|nr:PAS domain-containing protein [Candidatus Atribacteria bacterium]
MKIKFRLYWDWFFLTGCIFFLTILWVRFGSLQESISLVGLGLALFWLVLFLIFYFVFHKGQNTFLLWGKQLFLLGVLGFFLDLFWKNRISSIGGVPSPFFLLSGGAILVVFGVLDVFREREGILQKLEKQKFLLDFLLECIPDHIYFKDKESRFIEGSHALARHFGFQRVEDLLGKTDFDIFSETHSKKTWEDERRIIETGEPIVAVEEMETWPDGKVTWVSTTKIPLRDKEGNIVGIMGISRNITESKLKEIQIEENEHFLSDLFESIQDGISVLNLDLTILRVNPYIERSFAHKMPLVGKKCFEAYHDRTAPCEICPSQEALRTGKKKMQILPYQAKGEIVGWSEVTAYPYRDREGKILGIIEYVKNITDRLKAEDALRESERHFHTLAETLPLSIVIYQDNRYVYFIPYTEVL